MSKKVIITVLIAIFISIAAYLIITGDNTDEIKSEEASGLAATSFYEISLVNDDILLSLIEKEGRRVIKSGKASPLRAIDLKEVKEGIRIESLEEALMIFEDFVS